MSAATKYTRSDREAVATAQNRVSGAILPMLEQADDRGQAFMIAMSATSAALGLAAGAFAALHDMELAEVDELVLAEEVLKMMREVRQQ